jgi:hypothetical protein
MSIYNETADLVAAIEFARTPPRFFLDRFFRQKITFEQEKIVFDKITKDIPIMAPFVSPLVRGKPQMHKGHTSSAFTPAYVKPKHVVKPGDGTKRMIGEPLLGTLSQEERYQRIKAMNLSDEKAAIEARLEWMAAKATIDGKVTISGDDYPTVLVDFGRNVANDITIVGAANMWNALTAPIMDQLETWSMQLLTTTGFAGTDVIMAPELWPFVRLNTQVQNQANLRRGITSVPDLQAHVATEGVRDLGMYGEFHFWSYAGRFRDQDGTISRALAATDLIMVAPPSLENGKGGIEGYRCFGAIQDAEHPGGLIEAEMWPKSWIEKDPSVEYTMTQSAPLMVPGRPDAVIKVKAM